MVGKMAISKAGHDKNQIYVIIREEEGYVYLCDGKLKTQEAPKKKSKKHIQPILNKVNEALAEKLQKNEKVMNEEIKKAVKDYKALHQM